VTFKAIHLFPDFSNAIFCTGVVLRFQPIQSVVWCAGACVIVEPLVYYWMYRQQTACMTQVLAVRVGAKLCACVCLMQLSGLNHGSAHAMLVDFGGTIHCQFTTDVFAAVFVDVPSFAYHCTLHGADERPAAAIANVLKRYDSSVTLLARVTYKMTLSCCCVELMHTRNGRDVRLVDLLLMATSAEVPPPAEIRSGSVEYMYVSSVMADGEFFGQLAKYNADTLEQFRSRLNEFYSVNTAAIIAGPRPGDFCCCQYDVDNLYYRTKIIRQFSTNKYLVSVSMIHTEDNV